MKTTVIAAMAALVLCAPATAQTTGRVIDLNRPQGRITTEQSVELIIEDKTPKGGWNRGADGVDRNPGISKNWPGGEGRFGKPDDQLPNGNFDDPSDNPEPKAKPGDKPEDPGDITGDPGDFEPGDGGVFKGLTGN